MQVCLLEGGLVYHASVRNSIWLSLSTARLRHTPHLVAPATRHCYCLLKLIAQHVQSAWLPASNLRANNLSCPSYSCYRLSASCRITEEFVNLTHFWPSAGLLWCHILLQEMPALRVANLIVLL